MDCIFCGIAKKEIPAKIVYEGENVIAFEDIQPKAPVHIVIIPKKHIPTVLELKQEDKELVGQIFLTVPKIAEIKKVSESGYRIVLNKGKDAGQTVDHLHFHLLGGKTLPFA